MRLPSPAAMMTQAVFPLTLRRRPWQIEPDDLSLTEWRKRVWKLLREAAMPGDALPMPAQLPAIEEAAT